MRRRPRVRMGVLGVSRRVRRGGRMRGQAVWRVVVEIFLTAHSNTVTAYTVSCSHGLLALSSLKSYLFSGAELGIAFLPADVTVRGFDAEKRGRIKRWRIFMGMKSGDCRAVWMEGKARICCAVTRDVGVLQTSRGDVKARMEMRNSLEVDTFCCCVSESESSLRRLWRPRLPFRRAVWMSFCCVAFVTSSGASS